VTGCCECGCEHSGSIENGEFLDQVGSRLFSGRTVACGVRWLMCVCFLVKLFILCDSGGARWRSG
jgi:hypothetical protein